MPASPTFAHNIAPIIHQNCVTCHRPDGVGPFSLLTYDDVRKHARQIAAVTGSRYMPPWPPEAGYGDFQDERRLTDEQIRTLAEWVRAGAPEGARSETPKSPEFSSGWQLGTPDLILKAPHPLAIPASGPDVFWNFIFDPGIRSTRYVRALEIRPSGNPRLAHHANLLLDRTRSSVRLESVADAGFPGMELTLDRNPFDPDSHFLFWKPGTVPYSEPDGLSWRLDPGNLLVLNTHLQPMGKPEQVQPIIGLYFTDKPPTRFPILVKLEDDGALNIPPDDRDFVISDDFRLPVDADVLAIYPHAHYLGKLLEAYATLPNDSRTWLIRIPDWDLNWQAVYRYRRPVFLPAGSVISMRFHYDNSAANPRNPHSPPKLVHAGNQATDEMGHLWLQLLLRGPGNHRLELQEAVMQHRLGKYPNDFSAHLNLGALLMARLDAQAAVSVLETATSLDAKRPEAHDLLGSALERTGRSAEAISQFELALKLDPQYIDARYNLAQVLSKSGKLDEAVAQFQLVAARFPNSPRLQDEFGELLVRDGKLSEALAAFDKALALDSSNEMARRNRESISRQLATR